MSYHRHPYAAGDRDEGVQAASRPHETRPETGVVVLSQFVEPEYAFALLEEGSARRAYSRVKDLEELTAPIHGVAAGGSAIDSKVVEALVAARSGQESSPLDSLTPRDRDALTEMARGKTSARP